MKPTATQTDIDEVVKRIEEQGFKPRVMPGVERTAIGVMGSSFYDEFAVMMSSIAAVDTVIPVSKKYKLASREFHPADTIIKVGNLTIGDNSLIVMAGPCSVENEKQIIETAFAVRERGAHILRGGAFKPRTSPYQFRGLGEEGLKLLAKASAETGLPVVTEVMTTNDVEIVAKHSDILQIGARNMQNFQLLEECGQVGKPILLKRGLSATIEEWLLAAEYILKTGCQDVILCERGIRSYDPSTRNVLDLSAVPLVKRLSHLPVMVDPSHGTGKFYLVSPMALAAVAAGADGLIIEVHPHPDSALSDGPQSLTFDNFGKLMEKLPLVAQACGRSLAKSHT